MGYFGGWKELLLVQFDDNDDACSTGVAWADQHA
jgi:hypothetical protein